MAGGKSTFLGEELLDHVLGAAAYTAPATTYIGIFTTLPTAGGVGGVEPSTGGYARISKTNNATNWPAASSGVKRNGTAISWSAFSADMPEFLGAGVWDAASGGNLLYWGPFATARTVLNGETFEIPANGGTFTEL